MKWWLDVPPLADGVYWAMLIQRWEAPRDWPAALQRVPQSMRAESEAYLRVMAARMRVARDCKRD